MGQPQPVALSTSKRKFHRLLDNLTAAKSTPNLSSTLRAAHASTTSLVAPTEPPSKRSRLSDISMARSSLDQQRSSTIRSIRPVKLSTTPRKTPNYAPYSQDAFLTRMKTFTDVKRWTSKPDAVSEVEWAKRGWVCEGWNTVACKGGCEARVVVALRPRQKNEAGEEIEGTEEWGGEVEEELVERYVGILVDGHAEHCLWRKAGCKEDIYHIPIARDRCEHDLRLRYQTLKVIETQLPPFESISFPGEAPEVLSRSLPASFFTAAVDTGSPTAEDDTTNITAFTLALFGWSGVAQDGLHLAICTHCFQRVGLWLYSKDRIEAMSKKIGAEEAQLRLNLLETHREHCPWKNAETQHNPLDGQLAGYPAWKTLQFVIGVKRRRDTATTAGSEISGDVVGEGELDGGKEKEDKGIAERWQRLKSKLKRTTSKRSLKSVKEKDS